MILYDNKKFFQSLLVPDGSVVLKSLKESIFPICLTLFLDTAQYYEYHKWTPEASTTDSRYIGGSTQFKYANGTFLYTFFIFAYLVVVRTTISYGRYWDGCSYLIDALTKWVNGYMETMSFVQASEYSKKGPLNTAEYRMFRTKCFRNWVLLGACALGQMGGADMDDSSLEESIAGELSRMDGVFDPECKRRNFGDSVGGRYGTFVDDEEQYEKDEEKKQEPESEVDLNFRRLLREFRVRSSYTDDKGREQLLELYLDEEERTQMIWAENKMDLIMMWITEDLSAAIVQKTVVVPAPLWSRLFQDLSDGMLSYQNALLIDTVKFPFAFSHFCNFLVLEFSILAPFAISYFTGNRLLGTISCVVISLGYFGLFNTALDLEEPFGQDKNDLPTTPMLREYAHLLESMLQSTNIALPRQEAFATMGPHGPLGTKVDEAKTALYDSVARVNAACKSLGLAVFAPWFSPDELLCFTEDTLAEKYGDRDSARIVQSLIWRECGDGDDLFSPRQQYGNSTAPVPPDEWAALDGGVFNFYRPDATSLDDIRLDVLPAHAADGFSEDEFFEETDSWPSEDPSEDVHWGVGLPDFADSPDSQTRLIRLRERA
jgi:predicted membrane chloride channel (bestrophin family)